MARISIGSASDVGMREDNEDSVLATLTQDSSTRAGYTGTPITSAGLLILADGMGGRAHGKVASETATGIIYRELAHILAIRRRLDKDYLVAAVKSAITKANERINELVSVNPDADGMGTTVAVTLIVRDIVCVGHVGDSRAYLLSSAENVLQHLTEDHSIVQDEVRAGRLTADEARRSKFRNMITRAVGVGETVDADVATYQLAPSTVSHVVVSSDGMHGAVTEVEMVRILRENSTNPQDAADALVQTARENGANDNISAIVALIDTRASADSYGPIGLDGLPHPVGNDFDSYGKVRKLPWLTRANVLAFVIGMLIMSGIAWRFFPRSVIKEVVMQTSAPVASPVVAPNNTSGVDYNSPTVIAQGPFNPNYLTPTTGGKFYAVSTNGAIHYTVDPSSGMRTASTIHPYSGQIVTKPALNTYSVKSNTYVYVSTVNPPIIEKLDEKGAVIRTLGSGMLNAPAALFVAPNDDVYVIDAGVLKRFKAVH